MLANTLHTRRQGHAPIFGSWHGPPGAERWS